MNLDEIAKLKFDRRLEQRREWLQPGEREAYLESLPDVSSKAQDGSEGEDAHAAAAPAAAPATPAGGFGAPTS